MLCNTIMHSPPIRLYADNTIQEAIDLLLEHHMFSVPVVDRDETFLGEISTRDLIGLLLPSSLTMEGGLRNTGFVRETLGELKGRLTDICDHLLEPYIDTDVSIVHPDSPLIDALMLLFDKDIRLPVVERSGGKLVGSISFMTLLRVLEEPD